MLNCGLKFWIISIMEWVTFFVLKKFQYVLQYSVLNIARLTCKFVRGFGVFIKILKENLNFFNGKKPYEQKWKNRTEKCQKQVKNVS